MWQERVRPCHVAWTRPARSGSPRKWARQRSWHLAEVSSKPGALRCQRSFMAASMAWRPRRAAARGHRPAVSGSSMWMRSRAADTREWASASAVANGTLPHPGGELLDVADGRHLLLAVDGLVCPLVADGDGVAGPGLIPKEGQCQPHQEGGGLVPGGLDLVVRLALMSKAVGHYLPGGGLQRIAAEAGDDAVRLRRKILAQRYRTGVLDVAADGIERGPELDHRLLTPGHLDDGRLHRETPDRLGQAVVVGEDNHLAVLGDVPQHSGQPLHLDGVHGLDGVVDDDEAEGGFRHPGTGKKQAQRQTVELPLAHDPERAARLAVDGDVEGEPAVGGGARTFEVELPELHAAALAQILPVMRGGPWWRLR